MTALYGIANCDTMKKARHWLDVQGVAYEFYDYRKEGVDAARLRQWADMLGWEVLLNRRGTTWRRLAEAERADVDGEKALALMVANPSLIKRPVVEHGDRVLVGFNEAEWRERLE
jgi:arsenate reductase